MDRLTAYAGRDNTFSLTLYDEHGEAIRDTYAGGEPLSLRIAPGHGHAPLPLAASRATWADASAGTIDLLLARADTATFPAGGAYLWVDLTDGDLILPAYEAWLEVKLAPGAVAPHPAYCAMADVYQVAPWIDQAIRSDPNLDADLGDQRGRARQRIDDLILSRAGEALRSQAERHAPILAVDPIRPASGVDGGPRWGLSTLPDTTLRDHLDAIRAHLDADRLMRCGRLTEAAARLAVAFALEHVLGNGPGNTPYQDLSARYRVRAQGLLRGLVARIDTDGDGVADLEIL